MTFPSAADALRTFSRDTILTEAQFDALADALEAAEKIPKPLAGNLPLLTNEQARRLHDALATAAAALETP